MAKMRDSLPKTMVAPETGEMLRRDVRPFAVAYKGQTLIVDLPGFYPEGDGESVHVGADMDAADAALKVLKERVDGIPAPATIRQTRKKLGLSQRQAGAIFKVGENAFNKYERGEIVPSGPTIQLMTLLNRHPELVKELQEQSA